MNKFYITLLIVFSSFTCYSQYQNNSFDYTIIFSGNYQNEIIDLSINNKQILNSYKLNNVDSYEKGHLSVAQKSDYIEILYNHSLIKRKKVKLDHILKLEVSINERTEKILVDLRKGKILLLTYEFNDTTPNRPLISIEQIQEPIIFQDSF